MAILSFLQTAVELQGTIDELCAATCASALCNGTESAATTGLADQYNEALDEQLLNIYLADDDYGE